MQTKNSNRLPSLDLARVIAMLMMVQGHTIYAMIYPEIVDLNYLGWDIWSFLRGFTAPVFLTVSGAVHVFANKREANGSLSSKTILRRIRTALLLFIVGYLLQFPAGSVFDLSYVSQEGWLSFYKVNILQLFGFTLLTALLLFLITRTDKQLAVGAGLIALIMTLLSPLAADATNVEFLPSFFRAYFSFSTGSLFPATPYSSYFFIGIILGVILKQKEAEERPIFLLKWSFPVGLVFLLIALPFSGNLDSIWPMIKSFNRSNPAIVLQREAFVFFGLGSIGLLHLLLQRFSSIYIALGQRALIIYVLHLMIIYGPLGLKNFYQMKSLSFSEAVFAAFIVEFFSIGITLLAHYSIKKYKWAGKFWLGLILIYVIQKFIF